jgi:hypothetical protein
MDCVSGAANVVYFREIGIGIIRANKLNKIHFLFITLLNALWHIGCA